MNIPITELISWGELRVNNQFINLGYENGWSGVMNQIYSILQSYMVPGSQSSETIANCVTEYRFTVDDGINRYIVVSKVDSGD